MVDKFLNSRWAKFLLAMSVAAFVGLQIRTGNIIVMILNIPIAFALTLFIEYKYKVLGKLFEIKSRKYIFISLSIAVYTAIEIVLFFYNHGIIRFFETTENSFALEIRGLLSEQFLRVGFYTFAIMAGVVALFVIFAVVYAIVSRFKRLAAMVWQGTDKLERVYLVAIVLIFGIFIAVVYSLSPIFWGDNTLPWRGINFIFDLDVGYNIDLDAQFISTPLANIRRLFYPLVNLPFALTARALGRVFFFIPLAYIYFLQLFHITLMALH